MKNGLTQLKSGGQGYQQHFKLANGNIIQTRTYTLPKTSLLSKMGVDIVEVGKDLSFTDKPNVKFRNKAQEYLAVGLDACKEFVKRNKPHIR